MCLFNQNLKMKVSEFIIKNGINALQNHLIHKEGKDRKMCIDKNDLNFHDPKHKNYNPDGWHKTREAAFADFHRTGHYRFYAKADDGGCVWVNGNDEIRDI